MYETILVLSDYRTNVKNEALHLGGPQDLILVTIR